MSPKRVQELINRGVITEENFTLFSDMVENPSGVVERIATDTDAATFSQAVDTEVSRAFKDIDLSRVQTFILTLPVKFNDDEVKGYSNPKDTVERLLTSSLFTFYDWPDNWVEETRSPEGTPIDASVRHSLERIFNISRNYNLDRGYYQMLYAILSANTLKPTNLDEDRSEFWRLVEQYAKDLLPEGVTYLVHVTDPALDAISHLEMRMNRERRRRTFKGGEFYFTVKNGGDFIILEHDEAYELKQDVIDLGTKPVVQ